MQADSKIQREALNNLQDLIEINLDSCEGFAKAAEETDKSHLTGLFREFASERKRFAEELQTEVLRFGEKPETDGTWKAQVHRWWMDARNVMTKGERDLYAEMERGEDAILSKYREAVPQLLGFPVQEVVQRQLVSVRAGHDRVRALRDATK